MALCAWLPPATCPPGVSAKRHQWSTLFDQEIARGIDWMRSLKVRVTNFSWGRTYEWSREKESWFALTRDWPVPSLFKVERRGKARTAIAAV